MGSPPHSHASVDHHSRESSSSRFSGSLKSVSRKVLPYDGSSRGAHKQWKEWDVIEEEGLLDDGEREKGLPRRCYFLAFVLGFFILFSMFSLILWGASRPQNPKITMKSIKFEQFKIQAGSDSTVVATDMITMNSTVKMIYRNTGTFFGVHVTSTPIDLSYSQINVASGTMKRFYQSRKSQRSVTVNGYGKQGSIVRKWSKFEQFNRNDGASSFTETELRCPIKSLCAGETGEAKVHQENRM
ncbi:uncharacterized protein LOC120190854 [Hibiscus syriacus]|uniref:uncharacterized protein LOC120190854 n=1 Tax=Hibiscus syriacus TaxID=106335 RepID=UPI001924A6FF|nr:uncharacterized protein LOC120190854 [Hibiscus syriacus]